MIRLILFLNLCITLSLTAQSRFSSIDDVSTVSIEVSSSSDQIKFGMSQDSILSITGKPDSVYQVYLDMDDVMGTYLEYYDGLQLIVVRNQLQSFTIRSNHYTLRIGHSIYTVGSSLADLKVFNKSFAANENGELTLNIARSDEYISFEIEADSI